MSFRKNYEILIGKANTDLKSAEILYGSKDDDIDIEVVFFHLQQAAEKYIKAVLSYMDVHFSKTHDLLMLLNSRNVDWKLNNNEIQIISELNEYAVNGRYNYIGEIVENIDNYFDVVLKIKRAVENIIKNN